MSGISKRVSGAWVSGDYGIMKTATDTITTLPADIYADGNNATVGISGNMEQNGTPTSQNPIQPSECGERTGNLLPDIRSVNGWVVGCIKGDGTYTPTNANGEWLSPKIAMTSGETITVSAMPILGSSMSFYSWNGTTFLGGVTSTNYSGSKFTTPANTTHIQLALRAGADNKTEADIISNGFLVMMNSGETALPYEPYGYKIPISSAGQTTNVYLGEVQSTRKIKKLVLTGEENWNLWSSGQPDVERYYFRWYEKTPSNYRLICTHLPFIQGDGNYEHIRLGGSNREDFVIFISKAIASTVADFKSYLAAQYAAGTPVTVWYALATEETGIVNEPIRKIGDYADEVSGITIPTIAGANSFDVLTTLKPSEVTVNYHGWHPVADVQKRESGAWH